MSSDDAPHTGAATQFINTEMMDIVDDNDVVIGTMTRGQAYAENYRKRIAYIFVIDPETHKIGLAVRSANVSWRPLHYNATAAGHVIAGEEAMESAYREMVEEIGLDKPLHFLDKRPITDPGNGQKFIDSMYIVYARADELVPCADEVDHVEFMTLDEAITLSCDENAPRHPNLHIQMDIIAKHWPLLIAPLG